MKGPYSNMAGALETRQCEGPGENPCDGRGRDGEGQLQAKEHQGSPAAPRS